MAAVLSADIIARVKDETDIVEIVRQHVQLKPAGAVYKGLCPFHKEKTPSFIVTPARARWHCFGCGTGGDVISFLMEVEGVTFPEAVEILARPLDIDLSSALREDESEGERRSFHRANETAMKLWQEALWEPKLGGPALAYLTDRGFGEKVLRDYDAGWAPSLPGWLEAGLRKGGVDRELALRADLLRPSDRGGEPFAYFRNRIIFPVKIISRQVAGFGGRVIDQGEPKYLNSSDSAYFNKGKLLYGFEASRMAIARQKCAVLVEGYLDLLALAQAGFTNVVATCGTAFTPEQAKLLRRGARDVILMFDGDKAGLKAAVRSADIALRCGLEPRIVRLPAGKDPADLAIAGGAAPIEQALKDAIGYVPFLKRLADARGGDRTLSERAVRQILATVAGIEDPLRREYVLQEAADVFGLERDVLRNSLPAPGPGDSGQRDGKYRSGGATAPASTVDAASATGSGDGGEASGVDRPTPRARGPRVRRSMVPVQVERIAADMLAHALRDESGAAAREVASAGDLPGLEPAAATLAAELRAWALGPASTADVREWVLSRWNGVGDAGYRGYVSRLLDRDDIPAHTDHIRVVTDCLVRLGRDARATGQ
ncbi:MAG: DNA primase [bacterium]|nr:DNA primase [bacterium]